MRYRRRRPEDEIQRAIFEHIKIRGAPRMVAWHTPMGGKRPAVEAAIMKGLGARAGVADVCILREGHFYSLELKAPNGKPPSLAQLKWKDDVNNAGGFADIAVGIDKALAILEAWGHLRGKAC